MNSNKSYLFFEIDLAINLLYKLWEKPEIFLINYKIEFLIIDYIFVWWEKGTKKTVLPF